MLYFIEAVGIRVAQTRFKRLGAGRLNAKPAMEEVGETMMYIIGKIFQSQGRRGGGSWRHLSEAWLVRKVNEGLDPRIGFATGALERSVTDREDPNSIFLATRNSISIGTALEYGVPQDENRPFTKFTRRDRQRMTEVVRAYLMFTYKHGRRVV